MKVALRDYAPQVRSEKLGIVARLADNPTIRSGLDGMLSRLRRIKSMLIGLVFFRHVAETKLVDKRRDHWPPFPEYAFHQQSDAL